MEFQHYGIRALISVMSDIGEVVVVLTNQPQSAMGHAITIKQYFI
jgi:5'-nucleotidase